jgi:hypothetical protein
VFEATADAVPVIAPVDEFKDNPGGKEPDTIEYVIPISTGYINCVFNIVIIQR